MDRPDAAGLAASEPDCGAHTGTHGHRPGTVLVGTIDVGTLLVDTPAAHPDSVLDPAPHTDTHPDSDTHPHTDSHPDSVARPRGLLRRPLCGPDLRRRTR